MAIFWSSLKDCRLEKCNARVRILLEAMLFLVTNPSSRHNNLEHKFVVDWNIKWVLIWIAADLSPSLSERRSDDCGCTWNNHHARPEARETLGTRRIFVLSFPPWRLSISRLPWAIMCRSKTSILASCLHFGYTTHGNGMHETWEALPQACLKATLGFPWFTKRCW